MGNLRNDRVDEADAAVDFGPPAESPVRSVGEVLRDLEVPAGVRIESPPGRTPPATVAADTLVGEPGPGRFNRWAYEVLVAKDAKRSAKETITLAIASAWRAYEETDEALYDEAQAFLRSVTTPEAEARIADEFAALISDVQGR